MVALDIENKIIQYIQSEDFKVKIFSSPKYSVEHVELLDAYGSSQLYIISTLIHLKNRKGLVITNYSKFVLLIEDVCTLYEGSLVINEEPIDIAEYTAKVFFCNDGIKIQYEGIFCYKKKANNIIFRLNSGLEIKELITSTNIEKFKESDYLKNGYVIIFKDNRVDNSNNTLTIRCNYEGIPKLGFDNILSQKRSCMWGESFIFPYVNYVPILKSKYFLTITHPLGTVLVGGNEIKKTDEGIISQLQSNVASPLPVILWGQYIYKTIKEKKMKYTIYIYHNKEYDRKLEVCIVDILKKYEHYYGEVPYTNISVVFDKYSRVSCTQGNIIIMRNNDVGELAHELAHLWWGSCVSFYGQGAKWLQEGMADISSNLYLEIDMEKLLSSEESGHCISLEKLLYNTAFGNDDKFFFEGMKYLWILVSRINKAKFIKEIKCFINKNKYKNVQSIEFLKLLDISEYSNLYKILGEGEKKIE